MTASDHLRIKDQAAGRTVAAARSIGSAYSKTVDSGAVKGWYIVWCGETRCEHTLKRILEPDDFAGKWLKVNRAFETLSRSDLHWRRMLCLRASIRPCRSP